MGHQFGGNHTQNNGCNRNSPTAMEPGSASSIMGYAGICPPNVQSNSDAYFHAISLQEIKAFLMVGGASCDQIIPNYNNVAPVVLANPDYTIPKSTPFVLTLSATCLLYTSDAADERSSVDLGGRRIFKKTKNKQKKRKRIKYIILSLSVPIAERL